MWPWTDGGYPHTDDWCSVRPLIISARWFSYRYLRLFGSTTADAEDRFKSEGHGAISTYDLFRLVRAVQSKEILLTPDRLTQLFTTVGIFDHALFTEGPQSALES